MILKVYMFRKVYEVLFIMCRNRLGTRLKPRFQKI